MGDNIFTKQQWQQVVADKLSGDEVISDEEIKEILDYLWDYLPPLLHANVIKILEQKYTPYVGVMKD